MNELTHSSGCTDQDLTPVPRPDPVTSDRSSPSIAAYVYAGNRPTFFVDPSGETFRPSDAGQARARFVTRPAGVPWPIIVEGGDPPYFSNCRQEENPCVGPTGDITVSEAIDLGLILLGGATARAALGVAIKVVPKGAPLVSRGVGALAKATTNLRPLSRDVFVRSRAIVAQGAAMARVRGGDIVIRARVIGASAAAATARFVGTDVYKFSECLRAVGQAAAGAPGDLAKSVLTCLEWRLRRDL